MEPLTSDNHPIQVDFLPSDSVGLPGKIGMTYAPGKTLIGRTVPWERDLQKDLTRLRQDYGTDRLISLIEAPEFELLNIPNLLVKAQAHGIKTQWFPIQDFGVPNSMTDLIALVESILAAAQRGETVVIHCRAGLGRTGLVAAACLVALGHTPSDAFARVRQARSGSVETPEQEAYVYSFAHVWRTHQTYDEMEPQ